MIKTGTTSIICMADTLVSINSIGRHFVKATKFWWPTLIRIIWVDIRVRLLLLFPLSSLAITILMCSSRRPHPHQHRSIWPIMRISIWRDMWVEASLLDCYECAERIILSLFHWTGQGPSRSLRSCDHLECW